MEKSLRIWQLADRLTLAFVALSLLLVGCRADESSTEADRPKIGITQIATHPALDEVRAGIIYQLTARGYSDGENVTVIFRNANGDPSLTLPIAQDFARQGVDVIVPISTPSALGAARATKEVPIVFSGVTDPVAVGLVDSLERPGGNITGTSDKWPFEKQIQFYLDTLPEIRVLGMLTHKGDDVSKIGVEAVSALAEQYGFKLRVVPVSSAADIYPSASALFQDVDAIYTGIDHLVLGNIENLLKASWEANKPVLAGESGAVEKGALLAISIDMEEFGHLSGDMVADVLDGSEPGKIPVRVVKDGKLVLNQAAAERLGIDISDLISQASEIYEQTTEISLDN